jgi:hypothetical protein
MFFTLADLRAKVLGRLDGNTNLYTTPEIDYVVNECIRTISLLTGFYRTTVSVAGFSVANQIVYGMPPSILIPSIVSFEGRQLTKISLKKLARQRRAWATDTTAARGRVAFWAPVGNGQFVITPADSQGGRDITVTGMTEPPLLVNPTDVISLENEYVEMVAEYGEHRLPLKEGGKVFADGSLALNDFYAKLKARRSYGDMKFPKYRLLEPKPKATA